MIRSGDFVFINWNYSNPGRDSRVEKNKTYRRYTNRKIFMFECGNLIRRLCETTLRNTDWKRLSCLSIEMWPWTYIPRSPARSSPRPFYYDTFFLCRFLIFFEIWNFFLFLFFSDIDIRPERALVENKPCVKSLRGVVLLVVWQLTCGFSKDMYRRCYTSIFLKKRNQFYNNHHYDRGTIIFIWTFRGVFIKYLFNIN